MLNRFFKPTSTVFAAIALVFSVVTGAGAQGPTRPRAAEGGEAAATPLRLTLQFTAGAAGSLGAWVPGAFALEDQDPFDDESYGQIVMLTLAASTVLTPMGVYAAGELAGGNGNYWYTLIGSAAGTSAGLIASMGLVSLETDAGDALAVGALMLPTIIGSMIAYELSQEAENAEDRREGLTFAPGAGMTADGRGGVLTVGGLF